MKVQESAMRYIALRGVQDFDIMEEMNLEDVSYEFIRVKIL